MGLHPLLNLALLHNRGGGAGMNILELTPWVTKIPQYQ